MHHSFSIVLPEAPVIPGLVFRHFRGEADWPNIAAVINASLAADRNSERITTEGLANIYAHPVHWDPQQDTLLVEVDGTLIGYANTNGVRRTTVPALTSSTCTWWQSGAAVV